MVHQIFITSDNEPLSKELARNQYIVKALYPQNECGHYRLWTAHTLREFIELEFSEDVLWAFDSLRPYSYKADLAKYCLMYHFGGWYFDIGVMPEFGIRFTDKTTGLFFTDSLDTSNGVWRIAASAMYSVPQREQFMRAIKIIVDNCRTRYYGEDALYPTSTVLLGNVFHKQFFEDNPDVMLGEGKQVAYHDSTLRKALTLKGEVFSWYKNSGGGDLKKLGATGVNNYNQLWSAREVYANLEKQSKGEI